MQLDSIAPMVHALNNVANLHSRRHLRSAGTRRLAVPPVKLTIRPKPTGIFRLSEYELGTIGYIIYSSSVNYSDIHCALRVFLRGALSITGFRPYPMEKISWTAHVLNEEVLCLMQEQRSLMQVIKQRQANWIGHVLRHDCLLKTVLEGKIEGKRPRGKPRRKMLDLLIEQKEEKISYEE